VEFDRLPAGVVVASVTVEGARAAIRDWYGDYAPHIGFPDYTPAGFYRRAAESWRRAANASRADSGQAVDYIARCERLAEACRVLAEAHR